MAKVLGLDLGTNSLGWALADEYEQGYALLDKGVEIFQEGVARDKNNEKPAVQDRTDARALRRHYFRRRLRKIDLLRVLVRYDLCPPLTEEQLSTWRQKKQYPLDEEFLRWQRTDDNEDRNPYHDRYVALTERLASRIAHSDGYWDEHSIIWHNGADSSATARRPGMKRKTERSRRASRICRPRWKQPDAGISGSTSTGSTNIRSGFAANTPLATNIT